MLSMVFAFYSSLPRNIYDVFMSRVFFNFYSVFYWSMFYFLCPFLFEVIVIRLRRVEMFTFGRVDILTDSLSPQ